MKFDNFSAQAFERFIQALAVHVFGPSVVVFGSGRDGGREATYEGSLSGFGGRNWNGYTVIQAKCRDKPTSDSRDAGWLCSQLTGELNKFVNNPGLKPPEYYLLCTNVELSSVPDVGGKAKVDNIFRSFRSKLEIKDWHVWSADELRSIVDNAPEVRKTFAAWVTPSDILSALVEKLVGTDAKRLLPLAWSRDLRLERDVRLRDAGQETEQPIFLENVFIDLPVDNAGQAQSFREGEDAIADAGHELAGEQTLEEYELDNESEASRGCVAAILQRSADKLDPEAVNQRSRGKRPALANRIVVLGGPGQGKSTLGQFLIQVFYRVPAIFSFRLRARSGSHFGSTSPVLPTPSTHPQIHRLQYSNSFPRASVATWTR
jgi:hypothetical protein